MTDPLQAFIGADIFDGEVRWTDHALIVDGPIIRGIVPEGDVPAGAEVLRLLGGVLCPGFVDLQVNGGGGIMLNDDQSVDTLRVMAAAHARLGATSILPTLITDTPAHTERAIDAVDAAIKQGVAGIIGLHLEGPHLSIARKGAHDPDLIRPMDAVDLDVLLNAAERLPMLKITVAPETVTPAQIGRLSQAGVLVSLGHSDASFAMCAAAAGAGARCVTHLFNAMSQLTNREPGLVGAALTNGALQAGLIADGVHVHPETLRAAMAAKAGPGRIFLVSDAMAVAGSERTEFLLNGRKIIRHDGRMTLGDGTLAGADLDLATAVRNLQAWGVADEDEALAMATSMPGSLCPGRPPLGHLTPGGRADFLHLSDRALAVWQAGRAVT
ncbi:N-acetylglucosamine-6-phosphate deacetylase [Jannaschia sp. EhC01]|nr:N-acetylglucosamine-6-phosphate deacetylase [Jannaschia sp. EhC01]